MAILARAPSQAASRLATVEALSPTVQALNRRAQLANRQSKRQRYRETQKEQVEEKHRLKQEAKVKAKLKNLQVRAERRARREDWDLAALAPMRDKQPRTQPYGTLDPRVSRPLTVATRARRNDWGIVAGDRVVIVGAGHRDRGRIGRVDEVREDTQDCLITGLNMANVGIFDWQLKVDNNKTPFRSFPLGVPLADVRLVAPLIDPETGALHDTIIEKLRVLPETMRQGMKLPKRRFVEGVHPTIELPFPDEDVEELEFDQDTLRIEVEERSWTPTLSVPPMPSSIIDELRNKYSRFRTRHDETWVAARDAEHYQKQEKEERMAARMISPLEERQLRRKAEKVAEGEPELSDEILSHIGAVMARNLKLEEPVSETQTERRV